MQTTTLLLLLVLFCSACDNNNEAQPDIKFERTNWDKKDGENYTYRKQMVNDLLNNYRWGGLKKDSVIKLLGEPNEIEEDVFMLYEYEKKYLFSFPLSTESLIIELASDSTVVLARK